MKNNDKKEILRYPYFVQIQIVFIWLEALYSSSKDRIIRTSHKSPHYEIYKGTKVVPFSLYCSH